MRPCTYLKPGVWLADLHDLAARSVPDARIAAELSRRHAPLRFTRRMVWYHRTAPLRDDPDLTDDGRRPVTAAEVRAWRDRQYQVAAGWGHLLPGETRVPGGRVWLGGRELRPREADALSLLRDHGPLTARQLAGRMGLSRRRPHLWGGDLLAGLCHAGLVCKIARPGASTRRRPLAYCLTESALAG